MEEGHKPCGCNIQRCPTELSQAAAAQILQQLCTILGGSELVTMQSGGLLTNDATLAITGCTTNGAGTFIQTYLDTALDCTAITAITSYVTAKGQVVAFATMDGASIRAVFNPDPAVPCKFLISEFSVTCPA